MSTMMGVNSNNNAMETDQPPNNNKKCYIDTNSVCVARENMEISSFVKDSMSKLTGPYISYIRVSTRTLRALALIKSL